MRPDPAFEMIAQIQLIQGIRVPQFSCRDIIEEFVQMGEMVQIERIDFSRELQAAQGFGIHPHAMENFAER